MAHSLELKIVAEGVERPEQLEFLKARGCDDYQGYFLAKPLMASEFIANPTSSLFDTHFRKINTLRFFSSLFDRG